MTDAVSSGNGWLQENLWVVGIIYVIFGPLIAFFGAKWFPYIIATLVGLFTISFLYLVADSAGWLVSTGASIGVLCGAIALGILAACLVRRNFKVMLALLGLVAGFFGGSLLFALISGMTGGEWNAVWGFWVFSCVCAVAGCIAAIYLGMPLVMVSTALVGSYLFMRAWTLFFPGNYPSEQELIDSKGQDAIEMGGLFWMYIGIFIVTFIISVTYQCKYAEQHHELKDGFTSA